MTGKQIANRSSFPLCSAITASLEEIESCAGLLKILVAEGVHPVVIAPHARRFQNEAKNVLGMLEKYRSVLNNGHQPGSSRDQEMMGRR